jgi:arylsulfatase
LAKSSPIRRKYREQTFERQKRLGVVPQDAKLTPRHHVVPAWDSANADQKRLYARLMEVFAAYGAHVDHEVGCVLDAVAKLPDADNTMVIYIVGDYTPPFKFTGKFGTVTVELK